MRSARPLATLVVLAGLAAGCVPPGSGGAVTDSGLIPAGYGSLRQDDITLSLEVDAVQVKVAPLTEWVIRLTAPDTYSRLSAIRTRAGAAGVTETVFLVSIYTESPGGAAFDPHDLEVLSQGTQHRPTAIVGLTSEWGATRLRQRATQQALYVFPAAVDPEMDMTIQVRGVRNTAWAERLPRLEAERARVRARSGG